MHKWLIGIFVLLIISFSIIGLLQDEGQMRHLNEISKSSVNLK